MSCTECGSSNVTETIREEDWMDDDIDDCDLDSSQLSARFNGDQTIECYCNNCGNSWEEM